MTATANVVGKRPVVAVPMPSVVSLAEHPRARARYLSPLRYPGAKAGLLPVLRELVESAVMTGMRFDLLLEPFAGGASTSLRLLADGLVERAVLADADPMVSAFWQVAVADTSALVARMREEHERYVSVGGSTAVERWDYWKQWRPPIGATERSIRFEQAARCLFLNRTTFSGILHGRAGPIGGRRQASEYTIGCRFNPEELAARLEFVGHLADTGRITDVWSCDWRETLQLAEARYRTLHKDSVLAYLDPPYTDKSQRLYATSFGTRSFPHLALAQYLRGDMRYRWILSYDNHPDLLTPRYYGDHDKANADGTALDRLPLSRRLVGLTYSAAASRGRGRREELLITSLPEVCVPTTGRFAAAS